MNCDIIYAGSMIKHAGIILSMCYLFCLTVAEEASSTNELFSVNHSDDHYHSCIQSAVCPSPLLKIINFNESTIICDGDSVKFLVQLSSNVSLTGGPKWEKYDTYHHKYIPLSINNHTVTESLFDLENSSIVTSSMNFFFSSTDDNGLYRVQAFSKFCHSTIPFTVIVHSLKPSFQLLRSTSN